ncbi:MAG: hypothetical protein ABI557_02970 [Aureliella sp.]
METRTRRTLSTTITLFAVGLTALGVQWTRDRLGDASTLTGWTLLASTAGLYLLSARKNSANPCWGRVSAWLQVHTYMGTFASFVFLMHIGWPIRGTFELLLAGCFLIVALSGIALSIMNRRTPLKLAAVAIDRSVEKIPTIRAAVAHDAHVLALRSAEFGEGATLAEYYQQRLLPFFQSQRSWLYRLCPNGVQRRQLLREMNDLERYLADQGNASRGILASMVVTKDDLDYQYALLTRLRTLHALHVALTWSLALMIGVHVVLVYRFQGVLQ